MNPRVLKVEALPDYELLLTFKNGEEKIFDVKPWLNKGIYQQLREESLFKKAFVEYGTVSWNAEVDFSPDTLYLESKLLETVRK